MTRRVLTAREQRTVDECVLHFEEHVHQFTGLAKALLKDLEGDTELRPYIHFIKWRLKSVGRLRKKLMRKFLAQKRGTPPSITPENLFQEINDLAGVRVLHLHTEQLAVMDRMIKRVTEESGLIRHEGPVANCWDDDYARLFEGLGIKIRREDSMYMSVHYVFRANSKTPFTIELQVRTLMEEVWGEISHPFYEANKVGDSDDSLLRVLARMTSGCTRLVDCIMAPERAQAQ